MTDGSGNDGSSARASANKTRRSPCTSWRSKRASAVSRHTPVSASSRRRPTRRSAIPGTSAAAARRRPAAALTDHDSTLASWTDAVSSNPPSSSVNPMPLPLHTGKSATPPPARTADCAYPELLHVTDDQQQPENWRQSNTRLHQSATPSWEGARFEALLQAHRPRSSCGGIVPGERPAAGPATELDRPGTRTDGASK